MSRPVKIGLLFVVALVYACVSWMIFDLQISAASAGFWLWCASLFLLIGAGFRVITNKFFGSFFVSYLMFGISGLIVLLLVVLEIASLPVFNKGSYTALANITVNEFSGYSMTEGDFSILPKQIAAEKAAKDLATQIPEDSGFLLMGGDLEEINGELYYVFSIDHKDKKTDSPGFMYVEAKTGASTFKKTDTPITYSPYKDGKNNIMDCISASGGNKKKIVESRLEIDDKLIPWWVSYEYGPAVSVMGGKKLSAVYITNPFTGGSSKYQVEAIPSWVDYKISLPLSTGIFNTAAKVNKLGVSIDDSSTLILPRGDDLYAYWNLKSGKEKNGGAVFVNLDTGAASVYKQESVGSKRITECLDAWEISSAQKTIGMPILTNLNGTPCFVTPIYNEEGNQSGFLFINGQDGSSYAAGSTWDEASKKLIENAGQPSTETPQTNPDDTTPPSSSTEEGGEGITYNLIAGFVDTITKDGDRFVITMVEMKPKYYIDANLITQEQLEAGKTNGLALQYPIEYDGKLEVFDCIPVDMSVMNS